MHCLNILSVMMNFLCNLTAHLLILVLFVGKYDYTVT